MKLEIGKKDNTVDIEKLKNFHSFVESIVDSPSGIERIYHYTTLDTLLNGLIVKNPTEGDEICLWGTEASCLNDFTELKTGANFLMDISEKHFFRFEGSDNNCDYDYPPTFFVTSFSLKRDFLPMWSMYSNNATGISLCFDAALIKEKAQYDFRRCVYLTENLSNEIYAMLDGITAITINKNEVGIFVLVLFFICFYAKGESIALMLSPYIEFSLSLKNEAYRYEDEVRLLKVAENDKDIKYRMRKNLIVPYVEQYFPKEALLEVIVGPNNDMNRIVRTLKSYLNSVGFEHVVVTPSKVPYRG